MQILLKNSVTYKALRWNVQSKDYNGIKSTNISMLPQKKVKGVRERKKPWKLKKSNYFWQKVLSVRIFSENGHTFHKKHKLSIWGHSLREKNYCSPEKKVNTSKHELKQKQYMKLWRKALVISFLRYGIYSSKEYSITTLNDYQISDK